MTYVISDIHGEFQLLKKLLDKINFSDNDTLLVLGDMIDKGTEGIKVLKYLYSLSNAKCIVGNHEYDFLKFYWAHIRQDKVDFDELLIKLQNYFPYDTDKIDWDIMDWLEGLGAYIELDDFIGVHSGVPLDENCKIKPLKDARIEELVYDRNFKDNINIALTEKCVLFGHTPIRYLNGEDEIIAYPKSNNINNIKDIQKIHLDTGVYLSGVLGCFCIDTCKCFYAKK